MSEPILKVRDLRLDIPVPAGTLHAVRGIDFDVAPGETLCIVGESGSGKSLTSLAVMGLLGSAIRRSAAELSFDGIDLQKASRRQMRALRGNRMAMIFQEPMTSLNPAYTIGDQLAEALRLHRPISKGDALKRAADLLRLVGITAAESRLRQFPHQLSGGLRQRVMIAMALICEPDLLIADEPTTALDVTIQAQILRLLVDLREKLGMALILITHDLGVVGRVADKVAVMYAGELVETGPAEQIFRNPAHPYTRGLLDCIPVPGRITRGQRLGTIPGIVPSLIGRQAGCIFRDRCPEAIPACTGDIPLRELARGHRLRCIHPQGRRIAEEISA
ncbi:ABC transporter ATP-binding protein [Paracoccus xiamenensis]|uniref:ABC transporter ATP-binding protein n=1 Tax=Paracoccus xiamenensis TaxID=2714901 RepID=UPI00140CF376|nr:ABC transporter ATP-binding protein [Paracoccus xiamenensis]NHF74410.1 ABC transporter ATP-binding protein [Paracoccus xiamenensis]